MPLTRARDRYTSGTDGVHFLMRDGASEIVCHIDYEALCFLGNTVGLTGANEIFEFDRSMIERAASNKFDRTSRSDYEVVTVTSADLGL